MVVVVVVVIDVVSVGVMVAGVDTEGEEVEPKSDLIGAATADIVAGVDVLVAVVDLKRLPPENNPTVAGWDVPAVLPLLLLLMLLLLLLLLLLPGRIVLDAAKAVDF